MTANQSTGDPAAGLRPEISPLRRIFTNRNLRLESIAAIGFDMDHTLAVYDTAEFDRLCFDLAIERLVQQRGYPAEIAAAVWLPAAAIRGLVVDKRLGNLLKIDAYNYVTRVRHGTRFLEKDEKRSAYHRQRIRIGNRRYRVFDTLFDLAEGSLYAALVDMVDDPDHPLDVGYQQLYDEIRSTVDTLHADGTLKTRIMADLERYFLRDEDLVATLEKFRAAGKRLFLLTNSETDYTGAVMNHLVGGEPGSWESLFDLVVCQAGKPRFFLKGESGVAVPTGENPLLPNTAGHAFTGGDCFWLEQQIGSGGDEILYFGDHTFGDILRSKKSVGWRTAMIVPEIEEEVAALERLQGPWRDLARLEEILEELVLDRDYQQELLNAGAEPAADLAAEVDRLDELIGEGLTRRARLQRAVKAGWNPHWESLFREGRAASRFGRQVLEFACVYTSRVSNFLRYPADKFFARPVQVLPHERWAVIDGG